MNPEQESPHWGRIVGDDWPEIPPAAWNGLATRARDAADALNIGDAAQALRGFDDSVRSSEALQPVRNAMAALQQRPQAFADALYATADTFVAFADLVRRTRNQILDAVAEATARIERETRGDNNDDGVTDDEAEAETDAATTDSILTHARSEVVDIVATALSSVGPQGFPSLDDIAAALGQPGPWTTGIPQAEPPKSAPEGRDDPITPEPEQDARSAPIPARLPGEWPQDQLGDPMLPPSGDHRAAAESPGEQDRSRPSITTAGPSGAQTTVTAPFQGAQPGNLQSDSPTHADSVAGGPVRSAGNADRSATDAAESESTGRGEDTAEEGRDRTAATERAGDLGPTGTPLAAPASAGSGIGGSAVPTVVPAFLPPPMGATAPAAPPVAPLSTTRAGPVATPLAESPRAQPAAVVKTSGPTGPGAPSGVSAAPANKPVPGSREGSPTRESGTSPESTSGSDELVKNAIGAAVAAAAQPGFVVGEQFDGDSALARTLLGGIRAVADSGSVGVDWAVSVMRHHNGVSAFVTSNEGRGWLPVGLFLPREVSTPWLWSVSEHAGWEGVGDPARVLAEFALAWGSKSGATLSALASSLPVDPGLRGQLREVTMSGSVPASTHMDLASPSAVLLDRLGIAGSPQMIERAAAVPDGSLAVRCLELAVDAHMRVSKDGYAAMNSVGAPDMRLRILRAIRQGREFPDNWWEELQDVDDLLAASVLTHRIDAGRVALGELRSDPGGSAESGVTTVRELTFQRRCNELVLLLAEVATRQILRDAVYAHAQIFSHPLFGRQPSAPGGSRARTVSAHGPR